jgi:epoxyqueuosine reductase
MGKTESVLAFAKENGADLVGIATVDRFEGAPEGHKPEDLLPGAKSVVALAKRIPLAIVKKIPGLYYEKFGYHDLNAHLRELVYRIALFLEDQGYEALPIDPSVDDQVRQVEILQEEPEPRIKIFGDFSHRHAVVQAGLGEIAASCMVVVPKFGPRVRGVSVITTAPLEPTPKSQGKSRFNICQPELCGLRCSKMCPAKALPGDGTIDHFKCRSYRNPAHYTLEYFKEIANRRRNMKPSSTGGKRSAAPHVTQTCGICVKVCPIGLEF